MDERKRVWRKGKGMGEIPGAKNETRVKSPGAAVACFRSRTARKADPSEAEDWRRRGL